jgi:2-oxoglutarate ferredoxin oxidoreductase subunit beta
MYEYYDKRVYELKDHEPGDYAKSLNKIREWDYNKDSPIALGVLYKKEAPSFEERFFSKEKGGSGDRDLLVKGLLQKTI